MFRRNGAAMSWCEEHLTRWAVTWLHRRGFWLVPPGSISITVSGYMCMRWHPKHGYWTISPISREPHSVSVNILNHSIYLPHADE